MPGSGGPETIKHAPKNSHAGRPGWVWPLRSAATYPSSGPIAAITHAHLKRLADLNGRAASRVVVPWATGLDGSGQLGRVGHRAQLASPFAGGLGAEEPLTRPAPMVRHA
jgi:hypothetical protein